MQELLCVLRRAVDVTRQTIDRSLIKVGDREFRGLPAVLISVAILIGSTKGAVGLLV